MSSPINVNFSEKRKQKISTMTFAIILGLILFSYTIALFAFISPHPDLRWDTSVTSDPGTFSPGDTVTLDGFLEEGTQYMNIGQYWDFVSTESVRWFIVVLSPDNMPIHVDTGTLTDIQGDVILDPVSFSLASDADTGIYIVRLMVWTDYLPTGDTRTNIIHEGSFDVS